MSGGVSSSSSYCGSVAAAAAAEVKQVGYMVSVLGLQLIYVYTVQTLWWHLTWLVKLKCITTHLNETHQLPTCIHICSQQYILMSIIHTQCLGPVITYL